MSATAPMTDRRAAYDSAALATLQAVRGLSHADRAGRMQAVVDAIWEACAPIGVSWVGFYLPQRQPNGGLELVLGPSRNSPACSPIGLHGVCGQAFTRRVVRIVRDVRDLGPDYIACDPRDRSELVLPLLGPGSDPDQTASNGCYAVLDLDSHHVGWFSESDGLGVRRVLDAAGLPGVPE